MHSPNEKGNVTEGEVHKVERGIFSREKTKTKVKVSMALTSERNGRK